MKNDPLVDLFYSSQWNDITSDVYTRDGIQITRGRPDEVQRIPPSTLNLTLDNRDGTYSPRNPMSALYGLIGRNTPIRVSMRRAQDTFSRTVVNGWGDTDTGETWSNFWVSGTADDFDVAAGVGTHSVDGTVEYRGSWLAAPLFRDTEVRTTVLVNSLPNVSGGPIEPGNIILRGVDTSNYYLFRVEVSTAEAVSVRIIKLVAGAETTVAGPTTVSGLTYTGQSLKVAAMAEGQALAMKVWAASSGEPLAWQLTGTDDTFLDAGHVGVRSGVGGSNTNTKPIVFAYDNFEVRIPRFHGEVESWPQRWSVDEGDAWSPITANGIMRRLGAPGTSATSMSALKRDILDSNSPTPVAYYPLEEGKDAPAPMPHGILGQTGIIDFASAYQPGIDGPTGTLALYGVTPIGQSGTVDVYNYRGVTLLFPPRASTGVEVFTMHVRWQPFDNPKVLDGATYADVNHRLEFDGGGIHASRIQLQADRDTPGVNTVIIYFYNSVFDLLGSPDSLVTTAQIDDGRWHEIQVRLNQNGGNIDTELWVDGALADTSTISSVTLGTINEVVLGAAGSYDAGLVVGVLYEGVFEASHITVHNDDAVGQFWTATYGHTGETAADRISRLCEQDGIGITIIGDSSLAETVGVQRPAPTLELLHDAADADGGILFEPRGDSGLAYRTHYSLYNQDPAVELDYEAGGEVAPPLDPVEDTDAVANDVTVTRFEGASARVVQDSGPLNVQAPGTDTQAIGRYAQDVTLLLSTDAQCEQQAAWRKHIGTWDEARYPVVNLDLTAMDVEGEDTLINQTASLDVGDRFTIDNPPSWLPPETIEQHAQGMTETIESHRWLIGANATPALPYSVGIVEDTTWGRLDSDDTTLNEALDTTETGVDIITVSVPWIDSAAYASQFPFDVLVGGERMTVTACSGTGLTQTFTVTRSVNGVVKSHASGTQVRLFNPLRIAR